MTFDDKKLTWAGAGPIGCGSPWGTIGEIVKEILTPLGYEITIETKSSRMNNARYVADGRADFGATHLTHLRQAFEGINAWAPEGPRPNLRAIANVNHPSWLAIAVKNDSEITDLAQIRERQLPARIRTGAGRVSEIVWEHYRLSDELLRSWGGSLLEVHDYPRDDSDFMANSYRSYQRVPWVEADEFDVIVDTVYGAYTPEIRHFIEASILADLRFLDVPSEIVKEIEAEQLGTASRLPHKLLRGLWDDRESIIRLPHAVYTRDDAPDAFVREVAEALDRDRKVFRQSHIPFSIDPTDVATYYGLPFHEAALGYYRESGYIA